MEDERLGATLHTHILAPGQPGRPGTIALPQPLPTAGPLISCLMVTRGGRFPAAFAIECFRRQNYADRELVIVCDTPGSAVAALVAELGDPRIRYIEATAAPLGALRNG